MKKDKIPLIFVPTKEELKIAEDMACSVIDIIDEIKSVELKCFIMQMLLDSFEKSFNVDIRNGVSIRKY